MLQDKKSVLTILPYDGDLAAARRVKTILDLAITIAKRENLCGRQLRDSQRTSEELTNEKEKRQDGY